MPLKDYLPPPPWEGPPVPSMLLAKSSPTAAFDFEHPPAEGTLVFEADLEKDGIKAHLQEHYYGPGMGDLGRIYGRIVVWDKSRTFQEADIRWRVQYPGRGVWRSAREMTGYIEGVGVQPSLRRRGLATWLVQQAEQRVRAYGGKAIYLMDHEESEEFWPTLGYRRSTGGALRVKRFARSS